MSAGSVAAVFGASFALSLSTSIPAWPMPGIISRESRRHGFLGAAAVIAGQVIPEAFLVVALVLLFDRFAGAEAIENALFISGGIVLIWIGVWTAALSLGRGSPFSGAYPPEEDDPPVFRPLRARTAASLAIGGSAVTLSSIEWFAVWFTARAALIARAVDDGLGELTAFAAGHWAADIGWLLLIASGLPYGQALRPVNRGGGAGQRLFDGRAFRGLVALSGVGLVALGAGFMHAGLSDIS